MAAPRFAPVGPTDDPRGYEPTFHVPDAWEATRPGDLDGLQPVGRMLGRQGPDQGYVLVLARRLEPKVRVGGDEKVEDALAGCVGVALRRASLLGRAPVIHDLTIALTVWGFLDDQPPAELVRLRRRLFEGVAKTGHRYTESRAIVDLVPEQTLRQRHEHVVSAYPSQWRQLLGLS
ncbi:MAG: hypothetical protein M3337_05870 [Actinomycetota bacterium]|nr:hypothetical protein [Actinomycetota bacterium]